MIWYQKRIAQERVIGFVLLLALTIATGVFGQTDSEKTDLKKIGKAFLIYSGRDGSDKIALYRNDYDGLGAVTTKQLATGLGSTYVGVNPGATLIVYQKGTEAAGHIYTMEINGANEKKLTTTEQPLVGNLKFCKSDNYILFTSGPKSARDYGSMTNMLWRLNLDGALKKIFEQPIAYSSSSYKYIGDTQIHGDYFCYRYDTKVYAGKLNQTTGAVSGKTDFGRTCESDFSYDGKYLITNNTAHTGCNIHELTSTGSWTKNIKTMGLFAWKTGEYRFANKGTWIIANPEAAPTGDPARRIMAFDWKTGDKVRLTFGTTPAKGAYHGELFFTDAITGIAEPSRFGMTRNDARITEDAGRFDLHGRRIGSTHSNVMGTGETVNGVLIDAKTRKVTIQH